MTKQPRRVAAFDKPDVWGRPYANYDRAIKLWRAHHLDCAIYASPMVSGFNGYVRLPADHPDLLVARTHDMLDDAARLEHPEQFVLFGFQLAKRAPSGYDALEDLDVHGSLTYGPDEEGWVGFDTGHAWDDWSDEEIEKYVRPRSEEAWLKFREMQLLVGPDMWPPGRSAKSFGKDAWNRDWTMEKLEAEVDHLAEQINARLIHVGLILNGA